VTVALSLACWDYDRTRGIREGRIRVEGVEVTYLSLPPEATFFRMMRHREFAAAELSLSSFALSCCSDERPFVGVPVFPSRSFRHGGVFVRRDAVPAPGDLVGKRVGVAEYQLTANVWIRGILADDHGVPVDSVTYHTGGVECPGRVEKARVAPAGIAIEPIPPGETLNAMLADGRLDAYYGPRTPSAFRAGDGRVARLFADHRERELEYYERTRIFPIMHVLVLRRDVYERHPWLAQSLYAAFEQAKCEAYEELLETAALKVALPWATAEAERARELMGDDYWSYGLEPNRHVLETFLRYHHEQGLSPRRLEPEELFAPETLESFVI
jgi:4,5-dihydroxyphthalate decarboxylase